MEAEIAMLFGDGRKTLSLGMGTACISSTQYGFCLDQFIFNLQRQQIVLTMYNIQLEYTQF